MIIDSIIMVIIKHLEIIEDILHIYNEKLEGFEVFYDIIIQKKR